MARDSGDLCLLFWMFRHVTLGVEGQVVGPGEGALANVAGERLGAGVLPVVPRQLVGPGEPPLALGPLAPVRFLSCNKGRKKEKKKDIF